MQNILINWNFEIEIRLRIAFDIIVMDFLKNGIIFQMIMISLALFIESA